MPVRQEEPDQKKRPSAERKARKLGGDYLAGVGDCAGGGATGATGCDFVVEGFTPDRTDLAPPERAAKTDKVIEVIMKRTVDHVVALERAVAAPRGPNAVWLP